MLIKINASDGRNNEDIVVAIARQIDPEAWRFEKQTDKYTAVTYWNIDFERRWKAEDAAKRVILYLEQHASAV